MAESNLTPDEKSRMVAQFKNDLYLNAAIESEILASAQCIADYLDALILESMTARVVEVVRVSSEEPK